MVIFERPSIPRIDYRRTRSSARVETLDMTELRPPEADLVSLMAPQRPQFDILIRVTAGRASHSVDFVTHLLLPGDILWVKAGQVQQWSDTRAIDGDVVLFQPEVLTPSAVDLLHRTGAWTRTRWGSGEYPDSVIDLLGMLKDLNRQMARNKVYALERILESLLLQLIDEAQETSAQRGAALYDRFLRLLDAQGSVKRSVETFANLLECTPKTLTLAVKERSDRTAKEAIDQRLALEAKRLLAYRPDAPIHEVAEALGFDDAANFSKFFKRTVRSSPGAWRSEALSSGPRREGAGAANGTEAGREAG